MFIRGKRCRCPADTNSTGPSSGYSVLCKLVWPLVGGRSSQLYLTLEQPLLCSWTKAGLTQVQICVPSLKKKKTNNKLAFLYFPQSMNQRYKQYSVTGPVLSLICAREKGLIAQTLPDTINQHLCLTALEPQAPCGWLSF